MIQEEHDVACMLMGAIIELGECEWLNDRTIYVLISW